MQTTISSNFFKANEVVCKGHYGDKWVVGRRDYVVNFYKILTFRSYFFFFFSFVIILVEERHKRKVKIYIYSYF